MKGSNLRDIRESTMAELSDRYLMLRSEDSVSRVHRRGCTGDGRLATVAPAGRLFHGETLGAGASAVSDVRPAVFPGNEFNDLLGDYPELPARFSKQTGKRFFNDRQTIRRAIAAPRMQWRDFLLLIGVSILLALSFNSSNPNGIPLVPAFIDMGDIQAVDSLEAMKIYLRGDAILIDAMPSNFYQQEHLRDAVNMPVALFDMVYLMNFADRSRNKEILVYGNTISRPYDREIAAKLQLLGYTAVKVIDGGLPALEAMGYPVERRAAK